MSVTAAGGDSASVDEGALRSVARALYARLCARPNEHENTRHLELEVRLCTLLSRATDNNNSSSAYVNSAHDVVVHPALARGNERGARAGPTVQMGVTDADFARIVHHVRHATRNGAHDDNGSDTTSAASEALAWQSTVEVLNNNKVRFKYVPLPDDGNAEQPMFRLVETMKKKRLCVVDVALPGAAYDVRVAVSNEDVVPLHSLTGVTDDAKVGKPVPEHLLTRGYTRFKERLHVRDGAMSYDLTRVRTQDTNEIMYEVEIEYIHAPTADKPECMTDVLSYEVLLTMLRCATQLASLRSLQGVTNPTAATYHDTKA